MAREEGRTRWKKSASPSDSHNSVLSTPEVKKHQHKPQRLSYVVASMTLAFQYSSFQDTVLLKREQADLRNQ